MWLLPGRPHLSLGTKQGTLLACDFPSSLLVCLQSPAVHEPHYSGPKLGPLICCDGWSLLPPGGATGLGPAGRNAESERKKHRASFFHLGPLLFKFSTLLTRWQHLAVPSCRRAEGQTATGPVVVGGLAKLVTGADAGIPLVSRQAGTIGKPIRLDITLCNGGKGEGEGAGCLGKPARQDPQLPDA